MRNFQIFICRLMASPPFARCTGAQYSKVPLYAVSTMRGTPGLHGTTIRSRNACSATLSRESMGLGMAAVSLAHTIIKRLRN